MCSLPDGYGSIETQKNLGADEVSLARNALREAQCACAAASISAGRYACMPLTGSFGKQTIIPAAPPDLGSRSKDRQFVTKVRTASTANNPAATMRTALNGILFAANLPIRTTGTSAISMPSVVPATTATRLLKRAASITVAI